MAKKTIQSIEPNIADLANSWLKSYKLDYKLEQESLNAEIDKALADYFTKNGGAGANRPDAKLLLQDKNLNYYPILICSSLILSLLSAFLKSAANTQFLFPSVLKYLSFTHRRVFSLCLLYAHLLSCLTNMVSSWLNVFLADTNLK